MSFNPAMPAFFANMPAVGLPFGTVIAPGGRIAAYVRSTAKNDDPPFIQENRVASINEACKRVRSGRPDVILVLDGHTETHSAAGAIWPNLKAGTVIMGCGRPGASNAPRVTLAHVGASIALNVADVVVMGLDFRSSAVLTSGLVATAAGALVAGCRFLSTGALAANSLIQVTGAADFRLLDSELIVDSTAVMVAITGAASTNFLIERNKTRQTQGTSGGGFASTANTAGISGHFNENRGKTATTTAGGAGYIILGAATITTVGNHENYVGDETAAASLVATGA